MITAGMLRRRADAREEREHARSNAIWAKHPDLDADQDADFPADLAQELRADWARQDYAERWAALRALWGPAIRNEPRDRRLGWTIYDGHVRARDEEWTLLRALSATVGIVLGLRWGDAEDRRWERRHGQSAVWAPCYDLAFWDSRSDGYGYSSMQLHLRAWFHVEIFSDGESYQ